MGSATYLENIKSLLDTGQLSIEQLEGLVRTPYADATEQTHAEMLAKHMDAARNAATRSVVLLRNEGAVLPLDKTVKRIAVIGPLGDAKGDINGPWSLTAKG